MTHPKNDEAAGDIGGLWVHPQLTIPSRHRTYNHVQQNKSLCSHVLLGRVCIRVVSSVLLQRHQHEMSQKLSRKKARKAEQLARSPSYWNRLIPSAVLEVRSMPCTSIPLQYAHDIWQSRCIHPQLTNVKHASEGTH